MAIDFDKVADRVFKVLKSRGYTLKMYQENGELAYDPSYEARRFFVEDEGIMVAVNNLGENSEIKVYLNDENDFEEIDSLLQTLRQTANFYSLLFNVRRYGEKVTPKEFAFLAYKAQKDEEMNESVEVFEAKDMSRLYGSKQSSYQKIGNPTRLIVRHDMPVDEEKFAARTRNINKIFVETAEGERFKFPVNWLQGARAMARHVSEGGTWDDEIGNHIKNISEEYKNLRKFTKHAGRKLDEDQSSVVETVKLRSRQIANEIKSIQGPLSYKRFSENFELSDRMINEDNLLAEVERISSMFDLEEDVARYVAQTTANEEKVNELKNEMPLERKVQNAIDSGLQFVSGGNKKIARDKSANTLIKIKDLASRAEDDSVSVFLSRIVDKLESKNKLTAEELNLTKQIISQGNKMSEKYNPLKTFESWLDDYSVEKVIFEDANEFNAEDYDDWSDGPNSSFDEFENLPDDISPDHEFWEPFFTNSKEEFEDSEDEFVDDMATDPGFNNDLKDNPKEIMNRYIKKQ